MMKKRISILFISACCIYNTTAFAIAPDIKANGLDKPINITSSNKLSITAEINAKDNTGNADWWVVAYNESSGWFYYDLNNGRITVGDSIKDISATYQGSLFSFPSTEFFKLPSLASGAYHLYFGVDTNMDNVLDDTIVYDELVVNVKHGATYSIVNTGQTLAYNSDGEVINPKVGEAFFGQDVNYQSAGFSFTDNNDNTVSDNNTQLTWQQTPSPEKYTWQAAQDYCATLELAGQNDWRAPSLKELISIEDFSQGWPYLNTDYFSLGDEEIGKQLQFWSSNDYKVGTTHSGAASAFGLNYGTGHIKAYPSGDHAPTDSNTDENSPPPPNDNGAPEGTGDTTQEGELPPPPSGEAPEGGNVAAKFVRCVRGEDYMVNEFVDNGDGTVSDLASGLMWMQADSSEGKNWENALAYTENLDHAGYNDWRLPNVKELQSIVDYSGVYPAIDSNFFQITDEDAYFWSSTSAFFSYVSEEAQKRYWAWYVAFGYAVDNQGEDSHGAGAVRYDTKVAGGPSGEDAERVYNYARAVRNINPTLSYPIVDTNQGTCYNNGEIIDCPTDSEVFYGQDAQYTGNAPSYTNNGNGTINDNVTGLVWTQGLSDVSMSWADASSYCESLEMGGITSWRLPNVKALWSLRDFSTGWPWIDTDYFHLVSDGSDARQQHSWSSDAYLVESEYQNEQVQGDPSFIVNDWTGHIKAMSGNRFVRCVSGNRYGINDFVNNGDGTISDNATGLMWAQDDNGEALSWEAALTYAENTTTADYDDWRLPNAKELQSIADYSGVFPAMDTSMFNLTELTNIVGQTDYPFYWSSTSNTVEGSDGDADSGNVYGWVLAVGYNTDPDGYDLHGAGSVVFTPKSEEHFTERDPEIHRYNYVRLVRGGDVTKTTEGNPSTYRGNDETRVVVFPEGDTGSGAGGQQQPDMAAIATQLGVTEEALLAALGDPSQGTPDFATAAETLGVTEDELMAVLGGTPDNGEKPANQPAPN